MSAKAGVRRCEISAEQFFGKNDPNTLDVGGECLDASMISYAIFNCRQN